MSDAQSKTRFEYGRHETFAVRHGWLGKGLERLADSEGGFDTGADAVVELGLGSRMVKSLRYWLDASGLAEARQVGADGKNPRQLRPSGFGEAVRQRDPFLEYPATWWFVHLHLARRGRSIWGWFFNDFRERTFERATCVDAYLRHLRLHAANEPSTSVAQRDVACLLLAYGAPSSADRPDPEDATSSPLRDLGLVVRHEDTGRFEKTRPLDEVPMEAFMACVAAAAADHEQPALSVGELLTRGRGPGRVFGLAGDAIEEMAIRAVRDHGALGVSLDLLGAERRLRVPEMGIPFWFNRHFDRIGGAA